MSSRYSRCESRCSRSYSSCSDSSEEREDGRHKRFDKFSNEREKYDTFISSRKRQYSSTSSDYSSSVEPLSKRTKTDYSPGIKLTLETDSPCQISLKVNSASSSQNGASKILHNPDHKSKTQRRNHLKRQLRKKGEYYKDGQNPSKHQCDTVYPRENERVNLCDDLPECRYSREFSKDNISDKAVKHESKYSRDLSRHNMSYQLLKHKSRYSRECTRNLPDHLPKYDSKYSREYGRDNTIDHLPRNETNFSRQNSREFSDHIFKHESSREFSRDQYDYLPKYKSGYSQEKTNCKKSEGKKSANSREKKIDTKYEDGMYPRYDSSRENNRIIVSANRSSSESDRSEHNQFYRRKDYK